MSANAYRCFECGKVESERMVTLGIGQWVSVRPLSLVLCTPDDTIREEEPFCSPECVVATMSKVKRVP